MSRNSQNCFLRSFAAAGSGIWQAIRQERNLRFHLAAAALVLYGRSFYSFSAAEDAALFLTMGLGDRGGACQHRRRARGGSVLPASNIRWQSSPRTRRPARCWCSPAWRCSVGLRCCSRRPQILLQVVELHLRSPLRRCSLCCWRQLQEAGLCFSLSTGKAANRNP